jgi:hypothetical protein
MFLCTLVCQTGVCVCEISEEFPTIYQYTTQKVSHMAYSQVLLYIIYLATLVLNV